MHIPKKYIHDRLVLLLLGLNTFLALATSLFVLFRLDNGRADGYIVQYRGNVGRLRAFTSGSSVEVAAFIAFAMLVLTLNAMLSVRVFSIKRQYAVAVLGMGLLLLIIAAVVSNALLVLR